MKLKKISIGRICAALGAHPRHWEDLSKEPSLKHFIGKRYQLLTPLFLINMGGIDCLEPPGRCEGVPALIEDYLNHPDSWWTLESYKRAISPLIPDPNRLFSILGVVEAGTRLQIQKITYKKGGLFGGRVTVLATIDKPQYRNHEVCCGTIMANLVGDEAFPEPRSQMIAPVD